MPGMCSAFGDADVSDGQRALLLTGELCCFVIVNAAWYLRRTLKGHGFFRRSEQGKLHRDVVFEE